jgi:hypothetical protein
MLEPDEQVLWTGGPDVGSTLRTQTALWWLGIPYLVVALALFYFGRVGSGWEWFVIMPGVALIAAPFLIAIFAGGTTYAITDRRAIIKHDALGKQQSVAVRFEDMDAKLEILPVRPGIGHLYFASGLPTRISDTDHTGKLAFRELAKPEAVAALLERMRAQGRSAP